MIQFKPVPLIFRGEVNCEKCKLCQTRQRVVTGFGNPTAKIMIVAEKPGPDENISMRPFTGPSGKLLRNYMRTAGLNLDYDCYYTNVVKCMPPGGRKPTVKEINSCKPWLEREINFVDPNIIVAMGEVATTLLLPGETKKITQVHGNIYEREIYGRHRFVVPTIHPAFVARNPQTLAPWLMADLRTIKKLKLEGLHYTTKFRNFPAQDWYEVLETIAAPIVGLDFETTPPVDIKGASIIGIGVCNTTENGVYYAFKDRSEERRVGKEC